MYGRPKITINDGQSFVFPNKNPNHLYAEDIEENDLSYGRADLQLAKEINRDEFNKDLLNYKSIFDQQPDQLQQPKLSTRTGEANTITNGNPNYVSNENLDYFNKGELALQKQHEIFSVNEALRQKNYPLAEYILGRPLRPEELIDSGNNYTYKNSAPIGVIVKTFDIREVLSMKGYLQGLEDMDVGYKIQRDPKNNNYIIVSGPEITKDRQMEDEKPNMYTINVNNKNGKNLSKETFNFGSPTESSLPPLYKDAYSVLSDWGITRSAQSSIGKMPKPVLLQLLNSFGVQMDPKSNNKQLETKLKSFITNTPEVYNRLEEGNRKGRGKQRVNIISTSKDELPHIFEDDEDEGNDEFNTPVSKKKKNKKNKSGNKSGNKTSDDKIELFDDDLDNDDSSSSSFVSPNKYHAIGFTDDDETPLKKKTGKGLKLNSTKKLLFANMTNKKLQALIPVYTGIISAGNNSKEIKQELAMILQVLYDKSLITKLRMTKLTKEFITRK